MPWLDMITCAGTVICAPFDLAGELQRKEEYHIMMEGRGLDPFKTPHVEQEDLSEDETDTKDGHHDKEARTPGFIPNNTGHPQTLTTAAASKSAFKRPKAAKRAARRGPSCQAHKVKREARIEATRIATKEIALKKGAKAVDRVKRVDVELGKIRVSTTGWHDAVKGGTIPKMFDLAEAVAEGLKAKVREAEGAMDKTREEVHFTQKGKNNIQGTLPACAMGISHGGGQTEPMNLQHSPKTQAALDHLIQVPAFAQFSGQANSTFPVKCLRHGRPDHPICAIDVLKFYAPRAYEFQYVNLQKLKDYYPGLRFNFDSTLFATCTFNFGPHFVSYPHLDTNNSAFTWCAVKAMGNYDPVYGGHLILWDLGLIIQFPPGSTILIPSAFLWHSNMQIRSGET
ncbi:hypothetical protein V5O48_017253 [Marasmius crinis-equi]|uniref:JmjC domain-containing protein n=1 Tax=Marasmius crinis-equi TaxID=585013 RepID=A0ABR3EPJ3_9AGAR